MVVDSKESPLFICTSCGQPTSQGQHMCERCGAPLTPHAHTDPVLGIITRGFAAQQAANDPGKLIVVIGTWLWMYPMFIVGIGLTILGIGVFVDEMRSGSWWGALGLPLALLGGVFMWISSVLIVR